MGSTSVLMMVWPLAIWHMTGKRSGLSIAIACLTSSFDDILDIQVDGSVFDNKFHSGSFGSVLDSSPKDVFYIGSILEDGTIYLDI